MWPDVTDPAEIKKRIAVAGIYHAEQQEREEKFIANPTKVAEYRAMVNAEDSFSIEELTTPTL
jgi:peptide deformylase